MALPNVGGPLGHPTEEETSVRPSERNDIERKGGAEGGFLRKEGICNGWDAEGDGEARTYSSSQKHHHALVLLDCNIEFIYYSPKTHLLHSRRGSNRRSCRTSVKEEVEANPLSISARGLTLLNRREGKVVPS